MRPKPLEQNLAENRVEPAKVKLRQYKCRECGHKKLQTTNHTNSTWSWDRVSVCPECPPYKKYPEFGGQTFWDYIGEVMEQPKQPNA